MSATCLPLIVWSTVLLWGVYANQMATKCQRAEQGCTQARLRDQPLTAPHTAADASNPKEGRMSCSFSQFYRCWKGGWGNLPPRGSVRAGISGCASQLSALCTDHVSWNGFDRRILFLSHKREKKHLPASTKGIISSPMLCWFVLRALLVLAELEIHIVN